MRFEGLKSMEGACISLTLADGSRIEDCEVVSAGRDGGTVWLSIGGLETFVPESQIAGVQQAKQEGSSAA